jgi:acetyltransferase
MVAKKPLVILKGGRHEESARAALSHTASIAGSDKVVEGALRQAGVLRVEDFQDLMDLGKALSLSPRPFRLSSAEGNNIAIITVTGGGGVVTTDLARDDGLQVPPLEEKTLEQLRQVFPPWMAPANPVDIWPAVEQGGFEAFSAAIDAVVEDPRIDGVLLLTFSSRFVGQFPFEKMGERIKHAGKPLVSWVFGDARFFDVYRERMNAIGAPVYDNVRSSVMALAAYLHFSRIARADAAGSTAG